MSRVEISTAATQRTMRRIEIRRFGLKEADVLRSARP
jgi:hypothetical protein